MKRVVITGIGIVSPIGKDRRTFWNNLVSAKSGADRITLFDASAFPVRIGAEVKNFDPKPVIKDFALTETIEDRKVLLALKAAKEAITDARLTDQHLNNAALQIGVGLEVFWLHYLTPYANEPDINEAMGKSLLKNTCTASLQTPLDTTARILGKRFGLRSGKFTNCSACAAGAQTIGHALGMLQASRCNVVIAGGTDSMLNPLGLGGFSMLKVLSPENDRPQTACRPFDISRKGTVLGEGAAFVIAETLEHALNRKANIYAELLGYGSSMDAFRVSDPDPTGAGAVQSMTAAMKHAHLEPEKIDCISAHGTGTIKNDVVETAAIKQVFGDRAYKIPVHSVKSMTGHMIAASGAAEAVAAALTVSQRKIPPTINLEKNDEDCDLDYVPHKSRDFTGKTVLSNSFGFGGQNATLIFGRYQ